MECLYCKKKMREIKIDWKARKYHRTCYKKYQSDEFHTYFFDKLARINSSNSGDLSICSSST